MIADREYDPWEVADREEYGGDETEVALDEDGNPVEAGLCPVCNGSGEGRYADSRCPACNGKGIEQ